MSSPDDLELLAAWRDGDRDAGNQILSRHFDSLYRFFRSKVPGDHDDLIQKTFAACVQHKEAVCNASSFRAYLFTIARRQLHKHLEAKYRDERRNIDISTSSICDITASSGSVIAEREEQRLLLEALRAIPVESQIILELHYWERMKTRELAESLEIPEGTVKSRLRRARELLREAMQRIAATPAILESTTTDLDGWASSLRGVMGPKSGD